MHAFEGGPTGKHFIEKNAKREDISPVVGLVSLYLFGRHIARRADRAAGLGKA